MAEETREVDAKANGRSECALINVAALPNLAGLHLLSLVFDLADGAVVIWEW